MAAVDTPLLTAIGDIVTHRGDDGGECATIAPMTTRWRRSLVALLAAAGGVAAVTIAIYPLREVMPAVATGVVYMLPVLLGVERLGTLARAWSTSVASAAALNFFHIPPTGRFTIADEQNWVALVVFLVAAVVTSTLAGTARARAEEAERRRREADLSAEMARVLLGGESLEDALPVVGQRIAQAFELPWVTVEAALGRQRRTATRAADRRRRRSQRHGEPCRESSTRRSSRRSRTA